jgi:outer membrane protein
MKRIFLVAAFLTLMMGGLAHAQAKDKIGYVDLSRLFDEYNKTKEYDKVLEEKTAQFEKERNVMIEKIKEAQGKLSVLAEDKKGDVEKDVEKMKNDLIEFDRQKKTDLTKDRNEKIREILLEIEKIVSDYAEKQGYMLILNDRVLIYGAQNMDLTEQILKNLNGSPAEKK